MTSVENMVKAPDGTKFWLLHLGYLEADASWFLRAGNISTKSNPNPTPQRRKLVQYAVLIEHPKEGLILWETGSGKDYPNVWGAPVNDIFAQTDYEDWQELPAQVERTGHKMSDIKMVIMGHLHLDHAGGLENFKGTDVPILTHELELKNAFYSVATKQDLGVYMPTYLGFDLNWKTFRGPKYEAAQGLTLRHFPGHTPGLCIMQLDLKNSGTWIFSSDMYLVKENFTESHAQGFLGRDADDWAHSDQAIQQLKRNTDAKILFGHDRETFEQYKIAPSSYD